MTKQSLRTLVIALTAFIVQCWTPVSGLADGKRACSNATLHGDYAFTQSGTNLDIGPVAVAGVFRADGKGNLTAGDTVSLNGEINQEKLNFAYQVNIDCTGTGTASSAPGQEPAHFSFVIIDRGAQVIGIHTDPWATLILRAKRQFGKNAGPESEEQFWRTRRLAGWFHLEELRASMLGHVEMNHPAPTMGQNHQDEQNPKSGGGHGASCGFGEGQTLAESRGLRRKQCEFSLSPLRVVSKTFLL
jgi:hypothetical protein